ncbi:MAG: hypothetical protein RL595_1558, partial [Planctomycetota bacterium]
MQHSQFFAHFLLFFSFFLCAGNTGFGRETLEAFLEKHCNRCHGPEKPKGELRLNQLSRDFKSGADSHRWAEVIERVNAGDMPPKKEPRPTQDEIAGFVSKLDSLI